MTADSLIEFFLLFMGYTINNGIWNILLYTGIFIIPIALKLLSIWVKVREEGEDEGNKGVLALPRMENAIYISALIIFFTVVPIMPLDLQTIQFDQSRSQQCHKKVPLPKDTAYAKFENELANKTAKVPLWWFLVHSLSKGVTRAAVATIPCTLDLRQLQFDVQNTQIQDPILAQEIQDFATMCYSKAFHKIKASNASLTEDEVSDYSWIGSDYFLNTPGYYDTYTSTTPRENFPYDSARDDGYVDVGRGGYPTCKQWWTDDVHGLKKRALEGFDLSLRQKVINFFSNDGEKALLQWIVSPTNIEKSTKGTTYTAGYDAGAGSNTLTELASNTTFAFQSVFSSISSEGIKTTLPFIQGIIIMMVVICIPMVTVLGAYNPKTVVTISVAYFALLFIPFWWELVSWLEERMIDLIYDNLGLSSGTNSTGDSGGSIGQIAGGITGNPAAAISGGAAFLLSEVADSRYPNQWVINTMMPFMYIALPTLWFGTISWAGFNIAAGMDNMFAKGAQNAAKQGEQVASAAKSAASTVIKVAKKGK